MTGGKDVGAEVVESRDVELGTFYPWVRARLLTLIVVSFTGSERVGRDVSQEVMSRFGKVILELGGNNGIYSSPLS